MSTADKIDPNRLQNFATAVYVAAGMSREDAHLCADTLVQADVEWVLVPVARALRSQRRDEFLPRERVACQRPVPAGEGPHASGALSTWPLPA